VKIIGGLGGEEGSTLLLAAAELVRRLRSLGLPAKIELTYYGDICINLGNSRYIFLFLGSSTPSYVYFSSSFPLRWEPFYHIKASLDQYSPLLRELFQVLDEVSEESDLLTEYVRYLIYPVINNREPPFGSEVELSNYLSNVKPPGSAPAVPTGEYVDLGRFSLFKLSPVDAFERVHYYPPMYVFPSMSILYLNVRPSISDESRQRFEEWGLFWGELPLKYLRAGVSKLIDRFLREIIPELSPPTPSLVMRELGIDHLVIPRAPTYRLRRQIRNIIRQLVNNEHSRRLIEELYRRYLSSSYELYLDDYTSLYLPSWLGLQLEPYVSDLTDLVNALVDEIVRLARNNLILLELVAPDWKSQTSIIRVPLPVLYDKCGSTWYYSVLTSCLVPMRREVLREPRAAPIMCFSSTGNICDVLPELVSFLTSTRYMSGAWWLLSKVPVKALTVAEYLSELEGK